MRASKVAVAMAVLAVLLFAGCGTDGAGVDEGKSYETTYPMADLDECVTLAPDDTEWLCSYNFDGQRCIVLRQHNGGGVTCRPSDGGEMEVPDTESSDSLV